MSAVTEKPKIKRAPFAQGSPEFEAFAHREVIEAVRSGKLLITPTGEFIEVVDDGEVAAPFPFKELETIGAKIAAYRAAGFTMRPVPHAVSWRARGLATILEVVGGSNEAPEQFISIAAKVIDAGLDAGGMACEPWMLVLEGIMKTHAPFENGAVPQSDKPGPLAQSIVASLRASAVNVPEPIRAAPPVQLKVAGRRILALRVKRTGKPGRGQCTAWTAARTFADSLGVKIPLRKSDAQRDRKRGPKATRTVNRAR